MLFDCLRVLGDICKKDFTDLTGTPVVSITVKREERQADTYALCFSVPFYDDNDKVSGQFLMGFGEERLASQMASSIGARLKRGPYEIIDLEAKEILAEFMNTVARHTAIAWKGLGLRVNFADPHVNRESAQPEQEFIASESFVLILTLNYGWMVFSVRFSKTASPLAGKRILLVDGSMFSRYLIKSGLDQLGLEVLEAGDGMEAVRTYAAMQPDLVITELVLPGLPGLEAMAAIRENNPTARFIVVSPEVSPEDRNRAWDLGALALFDKPVKTDELIKPVKRALATRGLLTCSEAFRSQKSFTP